MFEVVLIIATLLCGLVAGLLFAYAVVAMPGIGTLGDREFLRSFTAMDRVIQNNQPLFLVAWVGSVLALVGAAVLGFGRLDGVDPWLLVGGAVVYVVGVQVPTAVVNIPLNNRLQALEFDTMSDDDAAVERGAFEAPWNRWNTFRTVVSIAVTASLLVVLLRL